MMEYTDMTTQTLEFFFELSSPYSFLAATQVHALAERTGADITWKPFLLGAIFKAQGAALPASNPFKARYMFQDLTRWAARYGVDFSWPSRFPINAVKGHRAALAARLQGGDDALERMALATYHAYWSHDRDIADPEVLGDVAAEIGLDRGALLEAMATQEIKDELRAYTDDALARGVFGAPTFFLGEQMFWGNDRLDFVEQAVSS